MMVDQFVKCHGAPHESRYETQGEGLWRRVVTVHQYRYTVLFEPAEEGGYIVTCPSLPGLVSEGDTLEEARDMAADAIRGYLESLAKDGLPIPPEDLPP
jgi:antitoxin HicB